jgi:transposase
MGLSARSHSAGVPAVRDLQQAQPISRHAGTDAESRFVPGKSQPQKRQSTFRADQSRGLCGGYSQLTAFVRSWRGEQGKSLGAFVPLTFALGEAFQFDWSEEGLLIGGLFRCIQVSHMKLGAGRSFWLVAYPSQGHDVLFDAHTRSFGALGGVPHRGIYDDMKTAVDKVNKG